MGNQADKGILTLAIGRKFNKQAKYLAYSCIIHCPSLPRAIITDDCDYFEDLYDIKIKYTAEMGNPFKVKLKLLNLSPFYETLFLDSDTLVYNDVRFMWEYFDKQSIVYAGSCRADGKWYSLEIDKVIKHFDIPWIGKLNSGILLFRKDETGNDVFKYAASLYDNHGDMEIPFFREKMLPDEPFWAIALGKYGQVPTNDYGRLGRALVDSKKVKLDITAGVSRFFNYGKLIFPSVVHFIGRDNGYHYYYLREKIKLFFLYKTGIRDVVISYTVSGFLICIIFIKRAITRCLKLIKKKLL